MEHKEKEYNKIKLLDFFEQLKLKIEISNQVYSLRPKLLTDINSNFNGDFDFVVREKQFSKLFDVIYDICKNLGVNFILNQRSQNKKLFKFFINETEDVCLMVEFWTVIEFSTKNSKANSFNANDIFNAIEIKKLSENEIFSLLYITHLYHKNKQLKTEENIFRFNKFLNNLESEKVLIESSNAFDLLRRLKDEKISLKDANTEAIKILENSNIKNSYKFSHKVAYYSIRLRNKVLNLKTVVPIIGPDGVGKGTVSDNTLSKLSKWAPFPFKMLFRIKGFYSLRLRFVSNFNNEPLNKTDESIPYYIYFTAWIMIRLLRIFKPTKQILLDRYFMDYLGTPIRYLKQNQSPKKVSHYSKLLWLMPVPNKIIFLGSKDETLIARKNELPIVSVQFLQDLYCDFIIKKKPPVTLFVSTENKIEVSTQAVHNFLSKI